MVIGILRLELVRCHARTSSSELLNRRSPEKMLSINIQKRATIKAVRRVFIATTAKQEYEPYGTVG